MRQQMNARPTTWTIPRPVMPALLVLVSTACGNLTPGGLAETTVAVSGDADASIPAAVESGGTVASQRVGGPVPTDHDDDDDDVEGEVEIQFSLYLVREDGALQRLGAEELEARVDLRGRTEADVVDELVPAALFTHLRVVFREIEVKAEGLVVDGVPVTDLEVELDDVELVVQRHIDLLVEDGDRVELLLDLNTLAWIEAVDPQTGLVDESVFADLTNVVVR